MKSRNFLLATVKETPAEVEIVSHKLMLRAGMIRQLAAGIYSWLPSGLRVLGKVENIVREEMNQSGALEVLMPSVQPGEIWRESGRWDHFGPELLRFTDRHNRDFCLGPTHEEVITTLVNNEIHSYRQLPANFYQMQWKFRDEIRPRFGIMRCREFLMKDAYSFDVDREGMECAYQIMYDAYTRVFERLGLEFVAVAADSGAIGGSVSHEFHVIADSGEDGIGINTATGFASNLELIELSSPATPRAEPVETMELVDTPDVRTMKDLTEYLSIPIEKTLKTLIVRGEDKPVALVLRGDRELNTLKAQKIPEVRVPMQMESADEIRKLTGTEPGSIGPLGFEMKIVADYEVAAMSDFVCGANQIGKHYTGVNWGRDLPEPGYADLRNAMEGDPVPGHPEESLTVKRGIEVGHVFQLGTKYSEAFDATCLDSNSNHAIMWMGCYGIGVSRIVAAAIEQNNDEHGIIWPEAIAPFTICIVPINYYKSASVAQATDDVYQRLVRAGYEVLLDDRDERPGVIFADMDLIGIPHRLVISERGIAKNTFEYKKRSSNEAEHLPLDRLEECVAERFGTQA